MRTGWVIALPISVTLACGGEARLDGAATSSANAGSANAGSANAGSANAGGSATSRDCTLPLSLVPDAGTFEAPMINSLGSYQVTFQNRCPQTVWPAWTSTGGLDNSIVDTQIYFPMAPGADRTVTVYGGVREVGFWGRTGCNFDQAGDGACETGDCEGFTCGDRAGAPTRASRPRDATMFVLPEGFLGSYNLPMRVVGTTCGVHECNADLAACVGVHALADDCGTKLACTDICADDPTQCCRTMGGGCGSPDSGDLVITFCP